MPAGRTERKKVTKYSCSLRNNILLIPVACRTPVCRFAVAYYFERALCARARAPRAMMGAQRGGCVGPCVCVCVFVRIYMYILHLILTVSGFIPRIHIQFIFNGFMNY